MASTQTQTLCQLYMLASSAQLIRPNVNSAAMDLARMHHSFKAAARMLSVKLQDRALQDLHAQLVPDEQEGFRGKQVLCDLAGLA